MDNIKNSVQSKIEATKALVGHLKSEGRNTTEPVSVQFLFIGDKDNLFSLRQKLSTMGFHDVPSDYSEQQKSLLVSKMVQLDSLTESDVLPNLEKLAGEYRVVFDGLTME